MPNLETIRAKMLRRRCLAVLRAAQQACGDGWTSARACFSYLRGEFDGLALAEVEGALRYLAGKAYAEIRQVSESKFVRGEFQARITPHGQDVLDETIPADPGIEDNRV
jgi:hypothetical protein